MGGASASTAASTATLRLKIERDLVAGLVGVEVGGVVQEVGDAVDQRRAAGRPRQQGAAGDQGEHRDEGQRQVEAADVADEVLVVGAVDGDPHPAHAGEVLVERLGGGGGPEADDSGAGSDHDEGDLAEADHADTPWCAAATARRPTAASG